LVLTPVPLLIDEQCQAVKEVQLARRFILFLMLQCFDHSLELESIEFFFHWLLQHDHFSFLLEILSATNVVMRWRKRQGDGSGSGCWSSEFFRSISTLIAASTGPYGAIGSCFHPGRGVLLGQPDDPEAGSIAISGCGFFGEDLFKQLGCVRSDLCGPVHHA